MSAASLELTHTLVMRQNPDWISAFCILHMAKSQEDVVVGLNTSGQFTEKLYSKFFSKRRCVLRIVEDKVKKNLPSYIEGSHGHTLCESRYAYSGCAFKIMLKEYLEHAGLFW